MSGEPGQGAGAPALVTQFEQLAGAPGGVARLRELILALAVRGKLVPQQRSHETAETFLLSARQQLASSAGSRRSRKRDEATRPAEDAEPFAIPDSWRWIRLGDVVISSEAGWSPSCAEVQRREGRWGVLKVSAVSWGSFDPTANKELPEGLDPRPELEVCDGDCLLSRANTADLVARSVVVRSPPPRLMLSDKIIRLKLSQKVDSRYINLFNNSTDARRYYAERASGTSSSMKNVARETVLALPVALPPVAEQARIVARVDELMQLCDALEAKGRLEAQQHARLLETLLGTLTESTTPEELAANWQRVAEHFDLLLDRPEAVDVLEQTVLQLAVRGLLVERDQYGPPECMSEGATRSAVPSGWTRRQFGDFVTMLNGYAFKSDWFRASGIRLVRNVNVSHGQLDWSHSAFVSTDLAEEFSQFSLTAGDVVLSLDRPIISTGLKLAVIRSIDLPCLLLQRVARLTPDPKALSTRYMELWLSSDRFLNTIDPGRSNGVPHISTKEVAALEIDLPPVNEQARIVARVTELRRLCAGLRQRLAASRATQSRLAGALVESVVSA